ncbi:MAG: hypothetical protein WCP24_00715 [bacterium]
MNKNIITIIVLILLIIAGFLAWNYLGNRIIQRPEFTQNAPDLVPLSSTNQTNSNVKLSTNISKNVIVGQQNENRLNWERQELGSLKINIEKSDTSKQYFLPGNFICIPNEDRPINLTYEVNGKTLGAGGGTIPVPAGEKREYVYSVVLPSSDLYIKDFSQYINSVYYKNYKWVDYSQKGFDIGKSVLPLSLIIYSNDKELQSVIHCNNLGADGISKIADISIVR